MKVDSLEVEIQSSASQAIAELDKLSSRLTNISGTISGIKSKNLLNFSGTSTVSKGTSNISNNLRSASSSAKSLAFYFGKFYANMFLAIRGAKQLAKSIQKSMDYIETYNYFNVINDKIAKEFGSDFEKYGAESAEEYTDSFQNRLNELTGKMTGYNIGSEGGLYATDSVGLGMDPQKIMNYEASITSITNALGLCGETSVNTAKALTMLSADMSSLKNQNLDTVMTNFQSGLIGQSRALYKYGIDITNATLQTYAYKEGITKALSEMSQSDKMQLRLLAILDQSKVAWGDMANTVNGVANQYRIMQQQISNLARIIGNLFLPVIQKVLPYINAMIIALQRLFTWIGNLLGVKWSGLMDGISSGYDDTGLGAVADSAEDAEDALNDANSAANKLKTTTLGIDELSINNPNSDSGSGSSGGVGSGIDLSEAISDAFGDYEGIWNKAFKDMEDKASELADSIADFFKKIWDDAEPTREALKKLWDEGLSKLATFTWNTLKDFYNEFLVPVGKWVLGEGLPRFFNITNDLLNSINWTKLQRSLKDFYKQLKDFTIMSFTALLDFYEFFLKPIAVWTFNSALPSLLGVLTDLSEAINYDKINLALKNMFEVMSKFVVGIGEGLVDFVAGLAKILTPVIAVLVEGLASAIIILSEALKLIPDNTLVALGGALGGFLSTILVYAAVCQIAVTLGNSIRTMCLAISEGIAFLAAHPLLAVAAGIMALVGSIIAINENWNKQLADDYLSFQENIGSNVDKLNDTADALDKISTNSKEITEGADVHCGKIDELSRKYFELADNVGLSASGQEDLKDAAADLIEQVPGLNGMIDATTGEYRAQKDEIQAVIDKQKEYLQLLSYKNVVSDYEEAMTDANVQLKISENNYKKNQTAVSDLQKLQDSLIATTEDQALWYDKNKTALSKYNIEMEDGKTISASLAQTLAEYEIELGNQEQAQNNAKQALTDATEEYNIANGVLEEHKQAYKDLSDQVDQINWGQTVVNASQAIDDLGGVFVNGKQIVGQDALDMYNTIIDSYGTIGQDMYDLGNKGVIQFGIGGKAGVSEAVPTMTDELENQVVDWYNNNGKQVAVEGGKVIVKGVSDGWIEDTPALTSSMASLFTDHLNAELYKSSVGIQESGKAAITGYAAYSLNGLQEELNRRMPSTKSDFENFLRNATTGLPTVSSEFAKDTVDGYSNGITDNSASSQYPIYKWMSDVDTSIHDSSMKFGSPSQTAWNYGLDTITGFNNGITENTEATVLALNEWTETIKTTIQTGLGIGADIGTESMFSGLLTSFQEQFTLFTETWTTSFEEWKVSNDELYFGYDVWFTQLQNPITAYTTQWKAFSTLWQANMKLWWTTMVEPYFTLKQWTLFGQNMHNGIFQGFKAIVEDVGGIMNQLVDIFNQALGNIEDAINDLIDQFNEIASVLGVDTLKPVHAQSIKPVQIPSFATGGFPNTGELFMARENGLTEMVGQFGNRAAVANNDQIVEGISRAVQDGMKAEEQNSLLREQNSLLQQILENSGMSITLDGRELISGIDERRSRNGVSFA